MFNDSDIYNFEAAHEKAMGIIARMQADLDQYMLKEDYNKKAAEIRQEVILYLAQYASISKNTFEHLKSYGQQAYSKGWANCSVYYQDYGGYDKGDRHNKEQIRAYSIMKAKQDFNL